MYSIEEGIQHGLDKMGYQSLRDGQQEVIEAYLKGNDVFFCSPTGLGKSLCYEIAPYIFDFVLFGKNSVRAKDRMDHVCIVDPVCIVSFDITDARSSGNSYWCRHYFVLNKSFVYILNCL